MINYTKKHDLILECITKIAEIMRDLSDRQVELRQDQKEIANAVERIARILESRLR